MRQAAASVSVNLFVARLLRRVLVHTVCGQRTPSGRADAKRYPDWRSRALCCFQHQGRDVGPVLRTCGVDGRLYLRWRQHLAILYAQYHVAGRQPARGRVGATRDPIDHDARE